MLSKQGKEVIPGISITGIPSTCLRSLFLWIIVLEECRVFIEVFSWFLRVFWTSILSGSESSTISGSMGTQGLRLREARWVYVLIIAGAITEYWLRWNTSPILVNDGLGRNDIGTVTGSSKVTRRVVCSCCDDPQWLKKWLSSFCMSIRTLVTLSFTTTLSNISYYKYSEI